MKVKDERELIQRNGVDADREEWRRERARKSNMREVLANLPGLFRNAK